MTAAARSRRCAIYTRVSTEHGLEQEFNSLDNQREAAEAYIKSQAHEGWRCLRERYDDGGFSGRTMERPALQQLLTEIRGPGYGRQADPGGLDTELRAVRPRTLLGMGGVAAPRQRCAR